MKIWVSIAGATLFAVSGLLAAADFRVTAVYGSGERLGALVELEGMTKSVKAGDIVGGNRIAAVVAEGVELDLDGERVLVPLGGGSAVRIPPTAAEPTRQVKLAPLRDLVPQLKRVEQSLRDEQDDVTVQVAVARALGLPDQARIVALRKEGEVDGPRDALRKVRRALARGELPQVIVENVQGMHMVYIEPGDAGEPRR